jgi:hypothetical protein
MRRILVVGLAGITAVTLASFATLGVLYGDGSARPVAAAPVAGLADPGPAEGPGPAREAPGPSVQPPGSPATALPSPDGTGAGIRAPSLPGRPARLVPQAGAWDSIPPTSLHSWPRLSSYLESARPRVAPCFNELTQARYGRRPFTTVGSPKPGTGSSVVVLQLEADSTGRLKVVDAPVEVRGSEQDGLFACVQEALRGLDLAGQEAPGARYRIRYPLTPMGMNLSPKQLRGPRVRLGQH